MKKLMILAAAMVAAVAANAAAVTWNTGTLYRPEDSTKTATLKARGYAFTITEAQYTEWMAMTIADGMKSVYDTFKDSTATATITLNNGSDKNQLKAGAGYFTTDVGASQTQYLAFVLTYGREDAATVTDYIANVSKVTMGETPTDTAMWNVATIWGGTSATGGTSNIGWTAVPEPTSGLLLLLGMAGLALKRKRA